MTSPLQQMQKVRDDLRRQLEAIETFVSWVEADEAVKRIQARMKASFSPEQPRHLVRDPPAAKPRTVVLNSSGREAVDASVEFIKSRGAPTKTNDLVAEIKRMGIELTGKDPIKVFRTSLSKDPRLVSLMLGPSRKFDRAWWLAGQSMDEYQKPDLTGPGDFPGEKIMAPPDESGGAIESSGV